MFKELKRGRYVNYVIRLNSVNFGVLSFSRTRVFQFGVFFLIIIYLITSYFTFSWFRQDPHTTGQCIKPYDDHSEKELNEKKKKKKIRPADRMENVETRRPSSELLPLCEPVLF